MAEHRNHIDLRYRSLLQKAVRRGADNLVITTSALLEDVGPKEKNWLRKRTVIIVFEECWPLGSDLVFNKTFHSKVAALVKAARSIKARDAMGLGLMGYALSEGDLSVLKATSDDRPIRIIASAIKRPDDFWNWVDSQKSGKKKDSLLHRAARFKNIGHPKEGACTKAAAYLAVTQPPPKVMSLPTNTLEFPYWIVFDRHTRQGFRALRDIARDLHIPKNQLEWTFFFFECGAVSEQLPSEWWERFCRWRFQKIGIPMEEANLLWEPAKPQIMEALSEESRRLHKDIYRWKLANKERVASLKKKVELYISNFHAIHKEQQTLF